MFDTPGKIIFISVATAVLAIAGIFTLGLMTKPAMAGNQRAVTIHDGEKTVTVTTDASTIGEVLDRAKVSLGKHDMAEPARDTKMIAPAYTVNVYRARPVTIVDGASKQKVMSPYQSPRSIVMNADIKIRPEDSVTMKRIDNFMAESGPGLKVEIKRSMPILMVLNGKQAEVWTQADTVGAFLIEKQIKLGPKDGVSKPESTPITKNMILDIYNNGVPTSTLEQAVPFETQLIQDADKKVGHREVKEVGAPGRRIVTYHVKIKNGKEDRLKELNSVVITQPKKQVVIVGTKPSFDGDFAAALAKLRSCEGGYDSWNPAGPYYGAYQFDQGTWASSAPPGAEYGNATPAEQDQAARNLYMRRGWSPWPHCGASLPDIYR